LLVTSHQLPTTNCFSGLNADSAKQPPTEVALTARDYQLLTTSYCLLYIVPAI